MSDTVHAPHWYNATTRSACGVVTANVSRERRAITCKAVPCRDWVESDTPSDTTQGYVADRPPTRGEVVEQLDAAEGERA